MAGRDRDGDHQRRVGGPARQYEMEYSYRYDNRRRFFDDDDGEKRVERRGGRYQDRRRNTRMEEDEQPEWFTGGPTSQNEFIELVGFDDIPEEGNSSAKNHNKRERRRSKKEKEGGGSRKGSRSNTPTIPEETTTTTQTTTTTTTTTLRIQPTVVEPIVNTTAAAVDPDLLPGFNIDDFIGEIIGYPEELNNHNHHNHNLHNNDGGGGRSVVGGSSRLKQFFTQRDSPPPQLPPLPPTQQPPLLVGSSVVNSRRSSVDLPPTSTINNLLNGLDSTRFFAPISPADKTMGNSIVDLLQRASGVVGPGGAVVGGAVVGVGVGVDAVMGPPQQQQQQQPPIGPPSHPPPPSIKDLMMDGKGQSLEEVEAGIRNMRQQQQQQQQHSRHHNNINQMTAFDDFLSQVTTPQQHNTPPCSIPLNTTQQQQPKDMLYKLLNGGLKDSSNSSSSGSGVVKPSPLPPNAPTETDLIQMLMKGSSSGGVGGGGGIHPHHHQHPPQQQQRPPMPPPSVPNLNVGPTQDVIMKLLQVQQQQQQQKRQQQLLHQQQQQQQLDPIKQLMGGFGGLNVSPSPQQQQQQQQQQPQDQVLRDALLRPDVQGLLQRVASGQVTASQLMNQLKVSTISPSQRDAISTVLKFLKGQHSQTLIPRATLTPSPTPQVVSGGLSLGGSTSLSPRVASPNPDPSNMLNPHILQTQSRLSPLMFGPGGSLGNNLSVANVGGNTGPRRPLSHQELVAHTQSIMQKALLKQELEKAKE
ncbi:hypothetical protein Pcinc_038591, partial [Petrolisthes cinctipes]